MLRTLLLLLCAHASAGALLQRPHVRSRVLMLRGGKSATLAPTPIVKDKAADAAPAAVELKIQASALPSSAGESHIALPSAAFEALKLAAGDKVRVRKMKKAAFWSTTADQTIGLATEDSSLGESELRVQTMDVPELKLKIGESVLVAPVAPALAPVAGAAANSTATSDQGAAGNVDRYGRRRHNGFLRTAMWMMYGPSYGYGGYGYGYGQRRAYGGRAYYGGRRSYSRRYGGGRRMSGMGGRRRR